MKVREQIFKGILKANTKLPSSRQLAKDLEISRSTVIEAYEQLMAEGYLYGIEGSGTYVSDGIVFEQLLNKKSFYEEEEKGLYPLSDNVISFRAGVPDLRTIPIIKWGQIYKQITLEMKPDQMDYHNEFGSWALRDALTRYLHRVRGVETSASHIIITSGAAQAFSMLCRLLCENDLAVIENPLSQGLYETLAYHQVQCLPIDVDEKGIQVDRIPKDHVKLIFTTPSHQFPTGVVMDIKRRIQLIEYAREHDAFIIEDDYDSEFRYSGSPIQSMQNLATDCVIYVGTFSKLLSPAIRMGYMVLPDKLVDRMRKIKYSADLHSPIFEQLTMARFIDEGLLDKHISKMRKLYSKRRLYLIKHLKRSFGDDVIISGDSAGLHLIVTFRGCMITPDRIDDVGLYLLSLKTFYVEPSPSDCKSMSFVLGFGNTNIEAIDEGISRLKSLVQ